MSQVKSLLKQCGAEVNVSELPEKLYLYVIDEANVLAAEGKAAEGKAAKGKADE